MPGRRPRWAAGFSRGWLALAVAACALETIFRPYALLLWVFPLAAVWRCGRRPRAVCLAAAPLSFAAALFSMTQLSAPYFSSGGMDFGAWQLLARADVAGAVQHALAHAAKEWRTAWVGGILPTLQGDAQYVGVGCVAFAVLLAVTAACPIRISILKLCALGFALAVALVLLFMYNIAPRHLTMLCVLLLAALAAEDAPRAVVWLPVLALLLLPLQAQRSSLSTWSPRWGTRSPPWRPPWPKASRRWTAPMHGTTRWPMPTTTASTTGTSTVYQPAWASSSTSTPTWP